MTCPNAPGLLCTNRSAEIILAVLIFVSLNLVACYDWLLSKALSLFRFGQSPSPTGRPQPR